MFIAHPLRQLPQQALVAFCCLLSLPAFAQTPAKGGAGMAAAGDPGNAGSRVQPLVYVSVFGTYRAFADEPLSAWRDANQLTERIGGWRAYAREARELETTPKNQATPMPPKEAPNPVPPPTPASPPHGHSGHTKP